MLNCFVGSRLSLHGPQQRRFAAYIEGLANAARHADRRTPLNNYCTGLLLPGERKSVEPMAARLAPDNVRRVGFVSLTEALDLTTPAGRAMAGLLAIFAEFERGILRERTRAGLANARQNGKKLGRPATAAKYAAEIRKLYGTGMVKAEIARCLKIGRTSVRRILG
jgi:hypothetical protein